MAGYQTDVQKLVDEFVAGLAEIWRRQAIDSLTGGVGRHVGGPSRSTSLGRGRGGKRTQDELNQLAVSLIDFVTKNPGLRIEQINKQLGTSTKDVALPIRKLVADGVLKAKGKKRSTAYFPGEAKRKGRG